MQNLVAEFTNVSKSYRSPWHRGGTVCALQGISFGVHPGEVLGVLGPNRAGKTTLLKILLGLCGPTGGRVQRLGRPLSDKSTLSLVGYMHENQAFPRYLSARALLEFYGELAAIPPRILRSRVPLLLERLELADRSHESISRFSKGMVQRLALAQAMLSEPELLVLDEPMEGLDLNGRRLLQELIAEQRQAGKAVILVSHALAEVAEVCNRLVVLVAGRLAHVGSLADLVRDPDTGRAGPLETALWPLYHS
jgi:ABC-2 type transport system ATP-binding protein